VPLGLLLLQALSGCDPLRVIFFTLIHWQEPTKNHPPAWVACTTPESIIRLCRITLSGEPISPIPPYPIDIGFTYGVLSVHELAQRWLDRHRRGAAPNNYPPVFYPSADAPWLQKARTITVIAHFVNWRTIPAAYTAGNLLVNCGNISSWVFLTTYW
jgi:hypothetical protein